MMKNEMEPRNNRNGWLERFRTLRVSIDQMVQEGMRTLLISSTSPEEGKTFVATNLAMSFCIAGKNVLLVDGDLHSPTVHKRFDLPISPGFSDYLLSPEIGSAAGIIKKTRAGMSVLTSGEPIRNPSETLFSIRTAELIKELKSSYELIIFDSPPVLSVSDASILCSFVDGVLLIVRPGRVRETELKQVKSTISKSKARLVGSVLNQFDEKVDISV